MILIWNKGPLWFIIKCLFVAPTKHSMGWRAAHEDSKKDRRGGARAPSRGRPVRRRVGPGQACRKIPQGRHREKDGSGRRDSRDAERRAYLHDQERRRTPSSRSRREAELRVLGRRLRQGHRARAGGQGPHQDRREEDRRRAVRQGLRRQDERSRERAVQPRRSGNRDEGAGVLARDALGRLHRRAAQDRELRHGAARLPDEYHERPLGRRRQGERARREDRRQAGHDRTRQEIPAHGVEEGRARPRERRVEHHSRDRQSEAQGERSFRWRSRS